MCMYCMRLVVLFEPAVDANSDADDDVQCFKYSMMICLELYTTRPRTVGVALLVQLPG